MKDEIYCFVGFIAIIVLLYLVMLYPIEFM